MSNIGVSYDMQKQLYTGLILANCAKARTERSALVNIHYMLIVPHCDSILFLLIVCPIAVVLWYLCVRYFYCTHTLIVHIYFLYNWLLTDWKYMFVCLFVCLLIHWRLCNRYRNITTYTECFMCMFLFEVLLTGDQSTASWIGISEPKML